MPQVTTLEPGTDKKHFYTPSQAAKLLDRSVHQIDRLVSERKLVASTDKGLIGEVAGPGRRPNQVIEAAGVDRLRDDLLTRIGVKDELDSIRAERDELRQASETEVLALRGRVAELEEQLASVVRAIDLRLQADQEFIRALRVRSAIDSGS